MKQNQIFYSKHSQGIYIRNCYIILRSFVECLPCTKEKGQPHIIAIKTCSDIFTTILMAKDVTITDHPNETRKNRNGRNQ